MSVRRVFRFEIGIYFTVYIIYIVIGLYKIYALRDRILSSATFEFAPGWSWLQRPRDDSNDELENFTSYIVANWYWYLLHAVVSGTTRVVYPAYQCYGHAAVCIVALLCSLQLISVGLLSMLLLTFYLVTLTNSKIYTWLLASVWILLVTLIKNNHQIYETLGYTEYFTLILILAWSLLRGCSYGLSRANNHKDQQYEGAYNPQNYLGYMLYYPCLTYGPFISYKRFLMQQEQLSVTRNIAQLCLSLLRAFGWWLVMQFALHYLYIHYMARDVKSVAFIGSVFWQHAAGYFMGQFFFLYYIITYGVGIAFARYDGLNAPKRPRCIGRIHFYSDMWKHFDEGLYEFLFGHIYAELCDKYSPIKTKFFATAMTFGFVFVWHGCYTYVLIWSILNYCCLAAEKCFKLLVTQKYYTEWTNSHLGAVGAQRFYALLATQLFIPAAFSNVYFISGEAVGDYLMRGVYLSGVGNYLALCFCSYCFFQCSELLLNKTKTN